MSVSIRYPLQVRNLSLLISPLTAEPLQRHKCLVLSSSCRPVEDGIWTTSFELITLDLALCRIVLLYFGLHDTMIS